MKKNTMHKVLFVFTLTAFALACKKENQVPKPSLIANWNWIKTVTNGIVTETTTPTSAGFAVSLLLQKDSNFYVIKNTTSTNKLDTINKGKFKFVYRMTDPAPSADELPTQIIFNMDTPSSIHISNNFDTIAIYAKAITETVDTYVRRK